MLNSQVSRAPLILVVDSDVRAASVLMRLLQEDGFRVELATDGAAAIERLSRDPKPRALITDLWVPKVDGATIARYAASQLPFLPVFIITGHPHQLSLSAGPMTPPPTVFTKPFEYADLHAALLRAVDAKVTSSERAA